MKIRIHKTRDYTVMSNYHLKDRQLSLKAKGLLSVMLSLPDNWTYSIDGLVSICKEKDDSITTALKELKSLGYLEVIKLMPNETASGRFEYEYHVYETPKTSDGQDTEKQGVEKQGVENRGLVLKKGNKEKDNKLLNNKLLRDDEEKINNDIISLKEKSQNKRFSKPKVDEIKSYCDERGNNIDAQAFYDFYESKGWKVGTTPMKDWKACVRTWEHKDGFKPKKTTKEAETTDSDYLSLDEILKMIDET